MLKGALGVDDDEDGVDRGPKNNKIVDFDKLMRSLKFQNKLVEIKQPPAKTNMVSCILCNDPPVSETTSHPS
jgi:hypothetical protein